MTKDTALPVDDPVRSYSVEVAIDEVRVQVVAAMATWTRERISPTCRIVLRRRGNGFAIHVAATWDDPAGDAVNVAWVRACRADLARLAGARGDAGAAVR
jgi:hypothetical protein